MNRRGDNTERGRVDALLKELLDLDEEGARESRLGQLREEDAELGARLERLLSLAEDPTAQILGGGAGGLLQELSPTVSATAAPTRRAAGPWRLVRELGRGGMGTVYLGQRDDGEFHQEAAVKLVHAGEENTDILRRFELERQILATLRHENIAQLLDGGRTEGGQPYFAMEYVQGRSIKQYCDDERLNVDERLELFLQVARAVQHAHRNLVVHRDLKPSNIVVTEKGRVKLLDFGIAKVLGSQAGGEEPLTGTLLRVLTPEYASPEQIRGDTISPASDTYQLGLLLFELLTGQRAHRLESKTLGELERAVCETDPARPSTAVSAPEADPSAAWSRRTRVKSLSRKLHGDLDNIVLLALRKEPDQRYASVSQLIDDIERHLDGRPISARAPTLGYTAGKFLRRHALAVGVASAFVALLVGYAVTATVQSRTIARERDRVEVEALRAKRVSDFLVGIFRAADPYQMRGEEVTAIELLEAGSKTAHEELAGQPEVLSEILLVLGSVSGNVGAHERSEELKTQSLEQIRSVYPENHPAVARVMRDLASTLNERGDSERAHELGSRALAIYDEHFPPDHPDRLNALMTVGVTEIILDRIDDAESHLREEVEIRETLGERDGYTARALNNLASAIQRRGDYEEAEGLHRRALALRRFLFPAEHPDVSESLNNLAVVLRRLERDEEAEPLYREALEMRRKIFGPRHSRVANTLNNLAELTRQSGKVEEAIGLHQEALSIRREVWGPEHSNVAMSLHNLGVTYRDAGDLPSAIERIREALALFRRTLPAGHNVLSYPTAALGRILVGEGRVAEGAALLEESLELRLENMGEETKLTAEAQLALGAARVRQGRDEEAVGLIERGFATLGAVEKKGDPGVVAEANVALEEVRRKQGG